MAVNEKRLRITEFDFDDVKDNLKILLNDYLRKIDVVTREEFDVQKEVLLKTRKKLDDLEEKFKK